MQAQTVGHYRLKCSCCKKGWSVNDKQCKVFQKEKEEHTVKISSILRSNHFVNGF